MITFTLTPYDIAVFIALYVLGRFFGAFAAAAGDEMGRAVRRALVGRRLKDVWRRHHAGLQ